MFLFPHLPLLGKIYMIYKIIIDFIEYIFENLPFSTLFS